MNADPSARANAGLRFQFTENPRAFGGHGTGVVQRTFGHRMKALVTMVLLSMPLLAWAEPQMEMHRVQATTRDPSGWYLAASTHGSFSVLIPIPFNDFTVTEDDPKVGKIRTYTVGAKSAEGVKFSATETPIVAGRSPTNLTAFPEQFRKPGQTVSGIDTSLFGDYPSVSFSVTGSSSGAFMRCVKTPRSLILLILEYPANEAKTANGFRSVFMSSLKIKKTEPDGGANGSRPIRSETNRTSSASTHEGLRRDGSAAGSRR